MGTVTPRYNLYKPDPSENIDVNSAINVNLDALDASSKKTELDTQVANLNASIAALQAAVFGSSSRSKIPMCKLSKTAPQNIPDRVDTKIGFQTVSWENDGASSDLANDRIKIVQKGVYLVVCQGVFNGPIGGICRISYQINGAMRGGQKTTGSDGAGGNINTVSIASGLHTLNVDDLIQGFAYQSSGSGAQLFEQNPVTSLAMVYVGKLD